MPFDLHTLNAPQREAVTTVEGPLLVLAGAGSGKTRVITFRIAHLIEDHGVDPRSILAVSFTNKAAGEMRERVRALVPHLRRGNSPLMSTFHSLCVKILRKSGHHLGYSERFVIYDTADQLGVLRSLMKDLKVDERRFDTIRVLGLISDAKNRMETPDRFTMRWGDDYEVMAGQLYPRYQQALKSFGAVDFDDLIYLAVRLFREYPTVLSEWQSTFDHLMIDEYQDTNGAQFELARGLSGRHRNICVVGDDDQSIYGWRGADVSNILGFERHFEGARVVTLEENYRSTETILSAANAVIKNNRKRREKSLWSRLGEGEKIDVLICEDDIEEARRVVARAMDMRMRLEVPYEQMAILFRTNAQSRVVEKELQVNRVPYTLVGGKKFFDRKEIKDMVSYLRAAMFPKDEVALRRIVNYPTRGIGRTTLERVSDHAVKNEVPFHEALRQASVDESLGGRSMGAVAAFFHQLDDWGQRLRAHPGDDRLSHAVQSIATESGLRDAIRDEATSNARALIRQDNLDELVRAVSSYEEAPPEDEAEPGLWGFLKDLTLDNNRDREDGEARRGVTLMTLHSAKGLEFPYVFMLGMEETLLPHRRPGQEIIDLDEERRLCYVGITRARRKLILTRAAMRRKHGKDEPRTPSRFLQEIPKELMVEHDETEGGIGGATAQDGQSDEEVGKAYLQNILSMLGQPKD